MKDFRNVFGLVVLPNQRRCTLCRETIPAGLMGAIKQPEQTEKALCDRCLYLHCEALGLALQGVRLMRQAAAYRLGKADAVDNLGDHLIQYAVLLEQGARNTWPRLHPLAKLDCQHCLLKAYPELLKEESNLLRAVFRAYQRLRFKLQSQDVYFLRHIAFAGYSRQMKTAAIERVETFMAETGKDELCPKSITALQFLGEPVIDLWPCVSEESS